MPRSLFAIIDDLADGLTELKATLAPLTGIAGGKARQERQARPRKARTTSSAARPRKPVSRAVRASRQLQGQYLGAIRRLTKPQRTKVKALRAKRGVHAAIRLAKGLAK